MRETHVPRLCGHVQAKTGARAICIVDDPAIRATAVALLPGASGSEKQVNALEQDNVQLLIVGEAREWETVPYVQTPLAKGRHKALILLGHQVSEEAGMEECECWLRTV